MESNMLKAIFLPFVESVSTEPRPFCKIRLVETCVFFALSRCIYLTKLINDYEKSKAHSINSKSVAINMLLSTKLESLNKCKCTLSTILFVVMNGAISIASAMRSHRSEPLRMLLCVSVVFLGFYIHVSLPHPTEISQGGFRYDYTYRKDAKGWFKFHQIPATWENARIKCFHEGAVLASPLNKEIHAVMQDILKDQRHMAFTGVHSLTSTGDYFSIEGVHWTQMPIVWRVDEPDNLGDEERCLAMWNDGTLADVRCSNTRSYICYRNETTHLAVNSCGTNDQAYLEVSPGQCYKFHPECLSWRRAHVVCSAEGGHLAVINSNAESRLLYELYAKKFQTTSKCKRIFLFLGFHNPEQNNSPYWFTVNGQLLEESGFSVWAPNQPDNSHSAEYCGSAMFRNEESMMALNDIPCTDHLSFICEINGARIPYIENEDTTGLTINMPQL